MWLTYGMKVNMWLLAMLEGIQGLGGSSDHSLEWKLLLPTTKPCSKRIARKQLYKTERKALIYYCHLLFPALSFPLLFFQRKMENKFEKMRQMRKPEYKGDESGMGNRKQRWLSTCRFEINTLCSVFIRTSCEKGLVDICDCSWILLVSIFISCRRMWEGVGGGKIFRSSFILLSGLSQFLIILFLFPR